MVDTNMVWASNSKVGFEHVLVEDLDRFSYIKQEIVEKHVRLMS